MSLVQILGGTIYDPANGVDGVVQDLWIRDGKIISAPSPSTKADRVIHAENRVVMPGGIDMHCHIAGPKVNIARKMRPEEKRTDVMPRTRRTRSGSLGSVPSTFATGYKYLGLGYTTAFDAAIPPLAARHAHDEFADTPGLDKGFYALTGNHHYVLQSIAAGDPRQLDTFVAWLLHATRGYGIKLVNPGGVEVWKHHAAGNVNGIDDPVDFFGLTPRTIIRELAGSADRLGLPHSIHLHCNNLGMPGNWATTLESMRALEGRRGHLTHIQFHSYGGGNEDESTFCSRVQPLAEYVNHHPNVTVDVGQVMFGATTSMTGDGPLGYYLHRVYGGKWYSADVELEAGCGIAPIKYRNRSLVHAWQWAAGLEWYLLVQNPWQVAMSTDHPNGASFLAYPQIIHLLMSRDYRREVLKSVHPQVAENSLLKDLDREYTLTEICIITRAGPARLLGLKHKGHLGPGADADLTLYTPHPNRETMFELPYLVMKSGKILVEQGEIRDTTFGQSLHVEPSYDVQRLSAIESWFERFSSVQFANYAVRPDELGPGQVTACG